MSDTEDVKPVRNDEAESPQHVIADDEPEVKEDVGDDVDDGQGEENDDEQAGRNGGEDEDENNDEDEEDEEEEEEEEEDDDEVEQHRRRKRPRKERRNQFLDVEAEVDEDEDEFDEDEEGLLREDGFIQEPEVDEVEDTDDRLHREVDRRRDAIAEEDAERLADEYRQRYGRSTASKYRGDSGVVPQRLLLPSVHDPNIWGVRCRIGKEKELVRAILKKKINLQYTKAPLEIFSAFQRDAFPGYIYVEARKLAAVQLAVRGFPGVFTSPGNMILVPIKEYPDMFRTRKSEETELTPGKYVRVKRGKYAGDLAIVENLSENGLEVQIKLVPRLDYGRAPVIDTAGGGGDGAGKRKRPAAARPPQRLFSANDAQQYDAQNLQKRGPQSYWYAGDEYENGYLIKDFKLQMLETEGVVPTLAELTKFKEGIDLQALSQSLKQAAAAVTFAIGEQVEVTSGEQAGMAGRVTGSHGDIVSIVGVGAKYEGLKLDVPTSLLKKRFSVGDHVTVTAGTYKDDTGMVVDVGGTNRGSAGGHDEITLLSDLSKTEITVRSQDLKVSSDTGGANTIGAFTLHDLVQINAQTVGCIVNIERDSVEVLAQDGYKLTLRVSEIPMKVTRTNMSATDRNGREIRVGDTVRETGGQGRQGAVLHIYRSFVFVYDKRTQENLGVFVSRTSGIATVATKGARDESEGLNLNKMNPNALGGMAAPAAPKYNVPRFKIVGHRVSVGSGPMKGFNGIVKDFNDNVARVELEAKNKIVNVDTTRLLFILPNSDRKVPFHEFIRGPGGPRSGPPGSMAPPGFRGGPSGAPSGPGGGGQTPAWGAAGAGTGGRTPAWSGSRTPAWGGGGGGRTPAWGDKTPAYGGGRTPAWNAGARTPAWNAGARTPAAGGDGSRSAAWNAGAATPSWDSSARASGRSGDAATPGFYSSADYAAPTPGGLSAPTPGVYRDEPTTAPTPGMPTPYDPKTPGAMAATPAAWGDDDGPKYEAATP